MSAVIWPGVAAGHRGSIGGSTIMGTQAVHCVLLADRHYGLTEGVRGLLETSFGAVVMVADESSLLESARRLQPTLAVVDLSLAPGTNLEWMQELRHLCPKLKLILLSVYDEPSVRLMAMNAGANGFVVKRNIATDLLTAVDTVLDGKHFGLPSAPDGRAHAG
jgi:two-component system secretion response regulator SsrB